MLHIVITEAFSQQQSSRGVLDCPSDYDTFKTLLPVITSINSGKRNHDGSLITTTQKSLLTATIQQSHSTEVIPCRRLPPQADFASNSRTNKYPILRITPSAIIMAQPTATLQQILPPPQARGRCYYYFERYACGCHAADYDHQIFTCLTHNYYGDCDCKTGEAIELPIRVAAICGPCALQRSAQLDKFQRDAEREDRNPRSTMSTAEMNEKMGKIHKYR